jgi:hypothetical protein
MNFMPGYVQLEAFDNLALLHVFLYTSLIRSSAQTFPARPERLASLRREFHQHWETRVINTATVYINDRLDSLEDTYLPLSQGGAMQRLASDVLNSVATLRARIPNELHF